VPSSDPRDADYFRAYRAHMPHPMMTSTESEGRCDLCGGYSDDRRHDKPWFRLSRTAFEREQSGAGRRIPLEAPEKPSHHDLSYAARQARLDALPKASRPQTTIDIPDKEELTTMRIAFTVEVPDLMAYARLVQHIEASDGKVITANMAPTPEEKPSRQARIRRRIAVTADGMRDLFEDALVADQTPEFYIDYRSTGDLTPTRRHILPVKVDGWVLGAIDRRTGGYKNYRIDRTRMVRVEQID
jgi:hypothetical protein